MTEWIILLIGIGYGMKSVIEADPTLGMHSLIIIILWVILKEIKGAK